LAKSGPPPRATQFRQFAAVTSTSALKLTAATRTKGHHCLGHFCGKVRPAWQRPVTGHLRWLRRRHIEPVIPTRKNQPRQEDFNKVSYRRRNIIERAVGWFK
jgi:hypothetical protein